jgi:hypothetical protein
MAPNADKVVALSDWMSSLCFPMSHSLEGILVFFGVIINDYESFFIVWKILSGSPEKFHVEFSSHCPRRPAS